MIKIMVFPWRLRMGLTIHSSSFSTGTASFQHSIIWPAALGVTTAQKGVQIFGAPHNGMPEKSEGDSPKLSKNRYVCPKNDGRN
jgi:hypothetical protein